MTALALGLLQTGPALDRPDLLAPSTAATLQADPVLAAGSFVAAIDPELADTAAFCAAYQVGLAVSANCVVLAGKRGGEVKWAAAVILATTRADVNGAIRRLMDVRKISFAAMAEAVTITGMEYGGITAIGLPADWPIYVDSAVVQAGPVVIGSGLRQSKIVTPGSLLASVPGAIVVEALAKPVG